MNYTPEQIANVLDYARLHPMCTPEGIKDGAVYATKNNIKSYCVASGNVGIASQHHDNVSSVIAFPQGNMDSEAKWREAQQAILFGARELDVVINYGRFLAGDFQIIQHELKELVNMAHDEGVLVKAILETCRYTTGSIIRACNECLKIGIDFVKTSTGFDHGGADIDSVQTMLDAVKGTNMRVKASGGIYCYADVQKYLDLGVSRIGSSRYQALLPSE